LKPCTGSSTSYCEAWRAAHATCHRRHTTSSLGTPGRDSGQNGATLQDDHVVQPPLVQAGPSDPAPSREPPAGDVPFRQNLRHRPSRAACRHRPSRAAQDTVALGDTAAATTRCSCRFSSRGSAASRGVSPQPRGSPPTLPPLGVGSPRGRRRLGEAPGRPDARSGDRPRQRRADNLRGSGHQPARWPA
jgi:hypothetical protein